MRSGLSRERAERSTPACCNRSATPVRTRTPGAPTRSQYARICASPGHLAAHFVRTVASAPCAHANEPSSTITSTPTRLIMKATIAHPSPHPHYNRPAVRTNATFTSHRRKPAREQPLPTEETHADIRSREHVRAPVRFDLHHRQHKGRPGHGRRHGQSR